MLTNRRYAIPKVVLAVLLGAGGAAPADAADEADTNHVQASLVAASATATPGSTLWLGLRLVHEPHWHTYWQNPGDSGLPTRIDWQLPDGYTAEPFAWPAPQRFDVGGLYNFGYDGDVVLPIALHVPASARGPATLRATAKWLMCREECIPGQAALTLDIEATDAAHADTPYAPRIAAARAAVPVTATWQGQARRDGDAVEIVLRGADLPEPAGLDAVPVERKLLDYAKPEVTAADGALRLRAGVSDYFERAPDALTLVLLAGSGDARRAWQVRVPFLSSDTARSTP